LVAVESELQRMASTEASTDFVPDFSSLKRKDGLGMFGVPWPEGQTNHPLGASTVFCATGSSKNRD